MSMQTEFQVVLLAGGSGSRMYPLSQDIPKCMLNVANRPLISFQLEFLEQAGFEEIFIVTNDHSNAALTNYMSERYRGKLKAQIIAFEDNIGTSDVIFRLKDKLTKDFIVISGDLIVANPRSFLHGLADAHRSDDAAVTALLYKRPEPKDPKQAAADLSPLFVGIASPTNRLGIFSLAADLDDDVLDIKKTLLRRMPRLNIRADLSDTHVYIVSRWALDVPSERKIKHLESWQGEFMTELVRGQFRKKWRDRATEARNSDPRSRLLKDFENDFDPLKCFVHVLDESIYCCRVNTLAAYSRANRDVASNHKPAGYHPFIPKGKNNFVDPAALVDQKTQVGADCVVGTGTEIGGKCSIKKSVIGDHCRIGTQCKVVNSVIMDHVTIEDGAVVQNSTIASNSYIRAKCSVRDTVMGVSYDLPAESEVKNDSLSNHSAF